MLPRRKALGYTEVVLKRECLLGGIGSVIRGHEFHYSEIVDSEESAGLNFAYELCKRKNEAAYYSSFEFTQHGTDYSSLREGTLRP
jgi:cobyrinic acid a,c-diamide synthase